MAGMADVPLRVIIVDDYPLFRDAICAAMDAEPDMEVVAAAADADTAVAEVSRHRPDVVLLDAQIPGEDTAVTLGRLRDASPDTRVVIISPHDEPRLTRQLLLLGVCGYLLLSSGLEELLSAVRTARTGSGRITLSISRTGLRRMHAAPEVRLSERERGVLMLAAQAMRNAQIGERLHISEETVKRHLRNVFVKLDAESRMDAVNKAIEAGLIQGGGVAVRAG
ncbi:response regulator [Actinomadura sp. LD22]|uniref:Response regulator n=2 Tax=Actinomadura physcomitrii TaxID=2650748 RepID=A0A6I4MLS4_9ACTN|nr:response regulator [Actinomadura physcomitrii]